MLSEKEHTSLNFEVEKENSSITFEITISKLFSSVILIVIDITSSKIKGNALSIMAIGHT
uniref:Uncharacterized protein n=1 Tax=Streptococcus suis TaxID=1307 RepID=A0A1X9I1N2_STRSU|nr:hypothetical protein [Streptococcus suis]